METSELLGFENKKEIQILCGCCWNEALVLLKWENKEMSLEMLDKRDCLERTETVEREKDKERNLEKDLKED